MLTMPDPATALQDLQSLLDVPCPEWGQDLACRGVELDCQGVADGQAALREALAGGGTYHDVLGRLGRSIEAAALPKRRRLIALAVADVARATPRRRIAQAMRGLAAAAAGGPAATA